MIAAYFRCRREHAERCLASSIIACLEFLEERPRHFAIAVELFPSDIQSEERALLGLELFLGAVRLLLISESAQSAIRLRKLGIRACQLIFYEYPSPVQLRHVCIDALIDSCNPIHNSMCARRIRCGIADLDDARLLARRHIFVGIVQNQPGNAWFVINGVDD